MSNKNIKYYSEGSLFIEAEEIINDIVEGVAENNIQYQTKNWCEEKIEKIYNTAELCGILNVYINFPGDFKHTFLIKLTKRSLGALNKEELNEIVLENLCFEEIRKKQLDWCVRIYNTLMRLSNDGMLTDDIMITADSYYIQLTNILGTRIFELGGKITYFGHAYIDKSRSE